MKSLSDDNRVEIIETFNSTSIYTIGIKLSIFHLLTPLRFWAC